MGKLNIRNVIEIEILQNVQWKNFSAHINTNFYFNRKQNQMYSSI